MLRDDEVQQLLGKAREDGWRPDWKSVDGMKKYTKNGEYSTITIEFDNSQVDHDEMLLHWNSSSSLDLSREVGANADTPSLVKFRFDETDSNERNGHKETKSKIEALGGEDHASEPKESDPQLSDAELYSFSGGEVNRTVVDKDDARDKHSTSKGTVQALSRDYCEVTVRVYEEPNDGF